MIDHIYDYCAQVNGVFYNLVQWANASDVRFFGILGIRRLKMFCLLKCDIVQLVYPKE